MSEARETVAAHFDAFNAGNVPRMRACLSDDVAHHVNEGQVRFGKDRFAAFCGHMSRCYREELTHMVTLVSEDSKRAAAEFVVNGSDQQTDEWLPEARGQTYRVPAGSFFSRADGRITRVVTSCNLSDWIVQVS